MPDRAILAPTERPKTAGLDREALGRAVLAWYDAVGRSLPFRGISDPWAILVSEAMAQQTQATRAGEAWTSFVSAYPTPQALAEASPADVLRAWRGLGYNRRAIALREAAAAIVREHGGRVPGDLEALQRLPGVGPYTARAVAALAFGTPVGAVDTNVRRVLGRLVASEPPLSARALQEVADGLVDSRRPGDWTHAIMDLGATVCRNGRPVCEACPLAAWCATARRGRAAAPTITEDKTSAPRGRRYPSAPRPGRRARETAAPFRSTARWLRGRIVDRLRDAPDEEWVRLDGRFGDHQPPAIAHALAALERDGLLERHPTDPALARLPITTSREEAAR